MTKYLSAWVLGFALIAFISCSDSNEIPKDPDNGTKVTLNDPVNNFIWKGMNSWYNWLPESVNLADSKDDDLEEYYTFLNGYTDYKDLMYSLCYKHYSVVGEENAVDRYSWFIEDYEVQEQSFQGIRPSSFGINIQAVQINEAGDVIIYISFVEPGSPADQAGIKRGDLINKLNGTLLTTESYSEAFNALLDDVATFSFVEVQGNELVQLEDKTVTRDIVVTNPVYLAKVFNDVGGKKVGYLVFNKFSASFNDEMNAAFSLFKNENVDELVLDLRFNGGGSGETTTYLASMIYGNAGSSVFYEEKFNYKHSQYDSAVNFEDKLTVYNTDLEVIGEEDINRLNTLDRLYVLVSESSASASELLINGLKPYMSSVKLIGTQTYGKNVGSITLYDAPDSDYLDRNGANPSHKYAMQPICIQVFNKNGESDYTQGFVPDIEVKEWNYWDNILPLGDKNEALLKTALDDIRGVSAKADLLKRQKESRFIEFKGFEEKFEKELYFTPKLK